MPFPARPCFFAQRGARTDDCVRSVRRTRTSKLCTGKQNLQRPDSRSATFSWRAPCSGRSARVASPYTILRANLVWASMALGLWMTGISGISSEAKAALCFRFLPAGEVMLTVMSHCT